MWRMVLPPEAAAEKDLQQEVADPEDWDWASAFSRLGAFAPRRRRDAMIEANAADAEVPTEDARWEFLVETRDSPGSIPPG